MLSLMHRFVKGIRDIIRLWRTVYFVRDSFSSEGGLFGLLVVYNYLKNREEWGSYISPFFDSKYYYEASSDVREAGLEPILHYIDHGWRELRSPSQYFDAEGFSRFHPHLNSQKIDLARTCLLLYGSYVWNVEGELVPTVAVNDLLVARHFTAREQKRMFKQWRTYRRFFDAQFYLEEYPEAASTPEEAFMHYMHRGFTEDRKPRRDFDSYTYRKKHELSRLQNPFRHCVDSIARGEVFPGCEGDGPILRVVSPVDIQDEGFGQAGGEGYPRLCIHLHCYYVDLLQEVVERLRPMTLRFSVVVTVCSEDDAAAARRFLDELAKFRDIQILVVRNRGRDIAPFLIDSSPIWRNSELVLHLHTKRSPHVSWGENWRRYLFDRTIGNEQTLIWAMDYFERHHQAGIIYPENYSLIRHYTEREQNRAAINLIAERLNLKGDLSELSEYPAGSMAFYRVSALTRIIDNDGLGHLFEAEDGQLDGTAAHAFERLLPESVRQLGYEVTPYVVP